VFYQDAKTLVVFDKQFQTKRLIKTYSFTRFPACLGQFATT